MCFESNKVTVGYDVMSLIIMILLNLIVIYNAYLTKYICGFCELLLNCFWICLTKSKLLHCSCRRKLLICIKIESEERSFKYIRRRETSVMLTLFIHIERNNFAICIKYNARYIFFFISTIVPIVTIYHAEICF